MIAVALSAESTVDTVVLEPVAADAPTLTLVPAPVVVAESVGVRESIVAEPSPRPTRLALAELTEIALEEIGWYYSSRSRSKDPATRQARRTIKTWLATLPKKRRAAISLTFAKRCPSRLLAKATTRSVRLLIQLYTKKHGGGVRMLERLVKREGSEVLWDLEERADELFRRAIIVYRRARGNVASVIPQNAK
jgi:hypothetical protein